MSESSRRHRAAAGERGPVRVAVVTASDTRTAADDTGGDLIVGRVTAAGHEVVHREIVRDDPALIGDLLDRIVSGTAQVVLVTGGTGIAPRDTTYDAIAARLEKTMPGFGEIFRMLSYEEVGAAAMLSRAVAGVYRGRVVISMPGSPNAVRLAMDRLVIPEMSHLAWEVGREARGRLPAQADAPPSEAIIRADRDGL
jgi:molybdopterin adenylyltransferase